MTVGLIRVEQIWIWIGITAFVFPLALAAMMMIGRAIARREWSKHIERFAGPEAQELVEGLRVMMKARDETIADLNATIERLEGRLKAVVSVFRIAQTQIGRLAEMFTLGELEGWLSGHEEEGE